MSLCVCVSLRDAVNIFYSKPFQHQDLYCIKASPDTEVASLQASTLRAMALSLSHSSLEGQKKEDVIRGVRSVDGLPSCGPADILQKEKKHLYLTLVYTA